MRALVRLWFLPLFFLSAASPLNAAQEQPLYPVNAPAQDIARRTPNLADSLTEEENAWLATAPRVHVAVFDMPPYTGIPRIEKGIAAGMAGDYLELLKNFLNITFVPVPVDGLGQAYAALADGRADMTILAAKDAAAERSLLFCPWLTTKIAIAARNDATLTQLENLRDKTLAVIGETAVGKQIEKNYPDLTLLPLTTAEKGLSAVVRGNAHAVAGTLENLNFTTRNLLLEGIVITPTRQEITLGFAVRADQPMLATLLKKGMADIPRETHHRIYVRWEQESGLAFSIWTTFWSYLITGLFCLLFVSAFYIFLRKIRREIKEKQKFQKILNTIFSQAPMGIVLLDAQMRCLTANNMAMHHFTLPDNYVGQTLIQSAQAGNAGDEHLAELETLHNAGLTAFEKGGRHTIKTSATLENGKRNLEIICMPLSSGQITQDSLIMLSMDITEHVLMEKEILHQRNFNESVVDALPLPVCIYGPDGNYMRLNNAYKKLLGIPVADVHSVTDNPMVCVRDRVPIKEKVEYLLRHCGGETQYEFHSIHPGDTQERTAITHLASFSTPPDNTSHVVATIIDITEHIKLEKDLRRALQEAEQAFLAKNYFLAHMSHELRTPINGILNLNKILLDNAHDAREHDFLQKISLSAQNLLYIVENILTFAEMNAHDLQLETSAFSIRNLLDALHTTLADKVAAKSLALSIAADTDVPETLVGDSTRLTQILFSLADNAVKYTEQGEVNIKVSVDERDEKTCRLLFEIRDTGIGMSEDTAASVFAPFTQGDTGMTRQHGGTGLGLSIAAKIVAAMQGEIACESKLGQGSRFYFTARLGLVEQATETAPESGQNSEANAGISSVIQNRRILLAEDNPINQLVAQEILTAFGALVDTVDNGEEAVKAVNEAAYDCILMDIQMPRMDGLTATRIIKSNPLKAGTPIIALTAHTTDEDRRLSLEAGMEDHLTKPINPDMLRKILERVLGARKRKDRT
jgi:signal transduction histidine kinase/ABC-type amino acid transport substrate-binding protein/ActR/RegA family two-component response regulator